MTDLRDALTCAVADVTKALELATPTQTGVAIDSNLIRYEIEAAEEDLIETLAFLANAVVCEDCGQLVFLSTKENTKNFTEPNHPCVGG